MSGKLIFGPLLSGCLRQVLLYFFRLFFGQPNLQFIKPGLPRSGKKFWKMKKFPGQGKVRELHFQSGKFKKIEKTRGKVREFQNFPKEMLVNRLLEILVSIICKLY